MDVSPLRLKIVVQGPEGKSSQLDWIEGSSGEVVASPYFPLMENETASVTFTFPEEFEMTQLGEGFTLPGCVRKSDITGLFLDISPLEEQERGRWEKILTHLADRLGKMARIHPRITIPEFELRVDFKEAGQGEGKVFDISQGGMRVVSNTNFSAGDLVRFVLQIPERLRAGVDAEEFSWQGVVRNRYPKGFGLEFSENPSFRRRIREIVDGLTKLRSQRLKYPRYDLSAFEVRGTVEFDLEGNRKEGSVRLRDISGSGSYILSSEAIVVTEHVTLRILPCPEFQSLDQPFLLSGRVARETPDGFVVSFSDLSGETGERLGKWVREIAEFLRPEKKANQPEPKATLTINYGNDLLFVREYLYNLSSGGFFLPGFLTVETGDIVRFLLDLSGTKLADRFTGPPSFLATVVRVTNTGIGVQFLDPDEVRGQLETVISDFLREHSQDSDRVQKLSPQRSEQPTKRAPGVLLAPHFIFLTGTLFVIVTLSLLYFRSFRSKDPAISEWVDSTAEPAVPGLPPAVSGPPPAAGSAPVSMRPEAVHIAFENRVQQVSLEDVDDVSFTASEGIRIILKDGTRLPGEALVQYLSSDLQDKLKKLMKSKDVK